jgi:hypothetical protein
VLCDDLRQADEECCLQHGDGTAHIITLCISKAVFAHFAPTGAARVPHWFRFPLKRRLLSQICDIAVPPAFSEVPRLFQCAVRL